MADDHDKARRAEAALFLLAKVTAEAMGGQANPERQAELREHTRQLERLVAPRTLPEYLDEVKQARDKLHAEAESNPLLARFLGGDKTAATEHLLARYGRQVLEQPRFLAEYGQTVALLPGGIPVPAALERADLVSRHALPPKARPPVERYDPANVAAVAACQDGMLAELEVDFARDGNPLHAWEALTLTAGNDRPVPAWVVSHLLEGAENLAAICTEVAAGKRVDREAEHAGRALGFGVTGRGRGSWFTAKNMLQRDRDIYAAVRKELNDGAKPDFAWQIVSTAQKCSRSTVERAYKRMKALLGEGGESRPLP